MSALVPVRGLFIVPLCLVKAIYVIGMIVFVGGGTEGKGWMRVRGAQRGGGEGELQIFDIFSQSMSLPFNFFVHFKPDPMILG